MGIKCNIKLIFVISGRINGTGPFFFMGNITIEGTEHQSLVCWMFSVPETPIIRISHYTTAYFIHLTVQDSPKTLNHEYKTFGNLAGVCLQGNGMHNFTPEPDETEQSSVNSAINSGDGRNSVPSTHASNLSIFYDNQGKYSLKHTNI